MKHIYLFNFLIATILSISINRISKVNNRLPLHNNNLPLRKNRLPRLKSTLPTRKKNLLLLKNDLPIQKKLPILNVLPPKNEEKCQFPQFDDDSSDLLSDKQITNQPIDIIKDKVVDLIIPKPNDSKDGNIAELTAQPPIKPAKVEDNKTKESVIQQPAQLEETKNDHISNIIEPITDLLKGKDKDKEPSGLLPDGPFTEERSREPTKLDNTEGNKTDGPAMQQPTQSEEAKKDPINNILEPAIKLLKGKDMEPTTQQPVEPVIDNKTQGPVKVEDDKTKEPIIQPVQQEKPKEDTIGNILEPIIDLLKGKDKESSGLLPDGPFTEERGKESSKPDSTEENKTNEPAVQQPTQSKENKKDPVTDILGPVIDLLKGKDKEPTTQKPDEPVKDDKTNVPSEPDNAGQDKVKEPFIQQPTQQEETKKGPISNILEPITDILKGKDKEPTKPVEDIIKEPFNPNDTEDNKIKDPGAQQPTQPEKENKVIDIIEPVFDILKDKDDKESIDVKDDKSKVPDGPFSEDRNKESVIQQPTQPDRAKQDAISVLLNPVDDLIKGKDKESTKLVEDGVKEPFKPNDVEENKTKEPIFQPPTQPEKENKVIDILEPITNLLKGKDKEPVKVKDDKGIVPDGPFTEERSKEPSKSNDAEEDKAKEHINQPPTQPEKENKVIDILEPITNLLKGKDKEPVKVKDDKGIVPDGPFTEEKSKEPSKSNDAEEDKTKEPVSQPPIQSEKGNKVIDIIEPVIDILKGKDKEPVEVKDDKGIVPDGSINEERSKEVSKSNDTEENKTKKPSNSDDAEKDKTKDSVLQPPTQPEKEKENKVIEIIDPIVNIIKDKSKESSKSDDSEKDKPKELIPPKQEKNNNDPLFFEHPTTPNNPKDDKSNEPIPPTPEIINPPIIPNIPTIPKLPPIKQHEPIISPKSAKVISSPKSGEIIRPTKPQKIIPISPMKNDIYFDHFEYDEYSSWDYYDN